MKKETEARITNIETARIVPNPNNPRSSIEDVSDLKASIFKNGLMQPITVRYTGKKDADGMPTGYEVIAGSRRFTACKELGLEKIPCIIRNVDDATAFELATTENIVRENMNAVDEALAVKKLCDEGKTRLEVAAIFGKTGRWVEGRKRIAGLGDKALGMLKDGKITLAHAEVLAMCDENRLERWLDTAKWKKPEELKRDILNTDRALLSKCPFNWKKLCKDCPKRSDCQKDLFGDVEDVYCLDGECYEKRITDECVRIEEGFKKAGFKPVPDTERGSARWHYSGWISATTVVDDEKEKIAQLKKQGVKAQYWIDEKTAENGLVFDGRLLKNEDSEDDEELDEDAPEALRDMDSDDIEEVLELTRREEKNDLEGALSAKLLNTFTDKTSKMLLVNAMWDGYVKTEESAEWRKPYFVTGDERFIMSGSREDNLPLGLDEFFVTLVCKRATNYRVNYDDGLDEWARKTFGLADRNTYAKKMREYYEKRKAQESEEPEKEP